jgi:hypothetical protein
MMSFREGALRTMYLTRLPLADAVLLTLGMVVVVTMTTAQRVPAEPPAPGRAKETTPAPQDLPPAIRSTQSGPWSAPTTWEGGRVPGDGTRVQIRKDHRVVYDLSLPLVDRAVRRLINPVIRSIHVAGTLSFARDRNTRLNVGLIKIQAGEDASEDGFNCDAHFGPPEAGAPRPALEVGTAEEPIPAQYTATIELCAVPGLDRDSCPAIVCCGGHLDLHGAPLDRTWVKLGAAAQAGDGVLHLSEPVTGWRVGDRIIITSTNHQNGQDVGRGLPAFPTTGTTLRPGRRTPSSDVPRASTEERKIKEITRDQIMLDQPLLYPHRGDGERRAEVANLSRNVLVRSQDPNGVRGHTMYHRHSAGAVSYAEFRHLGKEGVLGKYPIHFHLVGDTMRGSYVLGASIWDSGNRWVAIHGTQYLVVRDCVGYQSVGHGYFLENGTEVYNVLDRNLAVQSFSGKPLPQQELPFDHNQGAGFWWANSQNTFTRNVAVECDNYGFRYEVPAKDVGLTLPVLQADGRSKPVDVRTLPFIRFEDNEIHDCYWGIVLGEFVLGDAGNADYARDVVDPDADHPFVLRRTRIWNTSGGFIPRTRCVVEKMAITDSSYGLEYPRYDMVGQRVSADEETDARYYWAEATYQKVIVPVALGFKKGGGKQSRAEKRVGSLENPRPTAVGAPSDDFAPVTIITEVRSVDGGTVVRGATTDNGTVKRVLVNGQEARSLAANFAQWEATLKDLRPGASISACAEDAAGNVEKRPHVWTVK